MRSDALCQVGVVRKEKFRSKSAGLYRSKKRGFILLENEQRFDGFPRRINQFFGIDRRTRYEHRGQLTFDPSSTV